MYLDLLERALKHPDTRSVALTGSYGSGKSSILRALRRRWWGRRGIIELSLSTLDPDLAPTVQAENPAEKEMSNRIQKELVKQLLYQLPPRKTPRSRFPRATKPSWLTGVLVAVSSAVVVVGLGWIVSTLAGWDATITHRLDEAGWSVPWFLGSSIAGLAILVLAAWRNLAGRYALQAGLKAGALTVSLEPTSSSYFDQYLDEIMYFFQVSKTKVVLIEDVDRFGDAVVFDTLRALNTLVNGSGQVGRRVVFVYAIRDSVLGQIGAKRKNGSQPGEGVSALEINRANRAKYFDVIIPIVPFVTADNARDLMMQVMEPHVADAPGTKDVSPALIRLAARHLADMRTLWSIRNEFEVHIDRLISSARNVMPEINKDVILSLVLLRATSPDAYENIRLTTSSLDILTKRWLELVDTNIEAQTANLTDLRTQLENGLARNTRAKRAGQLLTSLRPELLTMARGFTAEQVEFSGPITDADLKHLAGWQQIADGAALTITLSSKPDRWSQKTSEKVQLGSELLARILGMSIDPQTWQDADIDDLKQKINMVEKEISFLRHHTWEQLYSRPDLLVPAESGEVLAKPGEETPKTERISFEGLVGVYAPTLLVRELISHGYLPRHFARYASMFYGAVLGLNAAEYISRAIEPGIPILEYALDEQDINQILTEQHAIADDSDLFDDPSVYNLDLVGYLLKYRPRAAKRVAVRLAKTWEDLEQSFVGRFFQRESHESSGILAALMTPTWADALRYTAVDSPVTPETRLHLVDAVLGAITADGQDNIGPDVGRYLSEHYADLPNLTDPPDELRATIVMATTAAAGGTVFDLTKLRPTALAAVTQISIYPVTANNLRALGGADNVTLDSLRSKQVSKPIYDHMLANLALYLEELAQIAPPGTPIKDSANFSIILNDIAATPRTALLDQFVKATSDNCQIIDLKDTIPVTWPALIDHRRTEPSFDNIQRYINEHGLDEALGGFLSEHTTITTPEATPQLERLSVATKILAARVAIPTPATRVALADSIAPGIIPIGQIAPEDANLVGLLLAANLLADEPETFDSTLLTRWADFESAVAASEQFGGYSDSTTLPARHLAPALRSELISSETKQALIAKLTALLSGATSNDATEVAQAIAERHDHLDLPRIETLRAAGASAPSLVRLIVAHDEILSIADLRAILLTMNGDYVRVSLGGSGIVRFDVDQDHRALLSRLSAVTHTGAKERYTKRHGTKLEAYLKAPSS